MRHAIDMARVGDWPASEAAATVTLDYDLRHRRRIALQCDDGEELLLDLPCATVLREGDGLKLDEGGWIRVHAAPEELLEIHCETTELCLRIVWHLGNRHCPAEISKNRVYIRHDHVIADMARGLGATVTVIQRPFHPEGGAYDTGGHHHG